MSVESIVFVVLVFTTFFNAGVQAYIHFEAYPLIAYVGKAEFSTYLKEYEGRLTIPLMLPYALTLLSNLALLFVRTERFPLLWVVIALILNIAVAAVTLMLATPIYNRIKQAGQAAAGEMQALMRINLLRLALSLLSGLVIIYLLLNALAA